MTDENFNRLKERVELAEKHNLLDHPYFKRADEHFKEMWFYLTTKFAGAMIGATAFFTGNYVPAALGIAGLVVSEVGDWYSTKKFNDLGEDLDSKLCGVLE